MKQNIKFITTDWEDPFIQTEIEELIAFAFKNGFIIYLGELPSDNRMMIAAPHKFYKRSQIEILKDLQFIEDYTNDENYIFYDGKDFSFVLGHKAIKRKDWKIRYHQNTGY